MLVREFLALVEMKGRAEGRGFLRFEPDREDQRVTTTVVPTETRE
jgi:hypothetical protein